MGLSPTSSRRPSLDTVRPGSHEAAKPEDTAVSQPPSSRRKGMPGLEAERTAPASASTAGQRRPLSSGAQGTAEMPPHPRLPASTGLGILPQQQHEAMGRWIDDLSCRLAAHRAKQPRLDHGQLLGLLEKLHDCGIELSAAMRDTVTSPLGHHRPFKLTPPALLALSQHQYQLLNELAQETLDALAKAPQGALVIQNHLGRMKALNETQPVFSKADFDALGLARTIVSNEIARKILDMTLVRQPPSDEQESLETLVSVPIRTPYRMLALVPNRLEDDSIQHVLRLSDHFAHHGMGQTVDEARFLQAVHTLSHFKPGPRRNPLDSIVPLLDDLSDRELRDPSTGQPATEGPLGGASFKSVFLLALITSRLPAAPSARSSPGAQAPRSEGLIRDADDRRSLAACIQSLPASQRGHCISRLMDDLFDRAFTGDDLSTVLDLIHGEPIALDMFDDEPDAAQPSPLPTDMRATLLAKALKRDLYFRDDLMPASLREEATRLLDGLLDNEPVLPPPPEPDEAHFKGQPGARQAHEAEVHTCENAWTNRFKVIMELRAALPPEAGEASEDGFLPRCQRLALSGPASLRARLLEAPFLDHDVNKTIGDEALQGLDFVDGLSAADRSGFLATLLSSSCSYSGRPIREIPAQTRRALVDRAIAAAVDSPSAPDRARALEQTVHAVSQLPQPPAERDARIRECIDHYLALGPDRVDPDFIAHCMKQLVRQEAPGHALIMKLLPHLRPDPDGQLIPAEDMEKCLGTFDRTQLDAALRGLGELLDRTPSVPAAALLPAFFRSCNLLLATPAQADRFSQGVGLLHRLAPPPAPQAQAEHLIPPGGNYGPVHRAFIHALKALNETETWTWSNAPAAQELARSKQRLMDVAELLGRRIPVPPDADEA